ARRNRPPHPGAETARGRGGRRPRGAGRGDRRDPPPADRRLDDLLAARLAGAARPALCSARRRRRQCRRRECAAWRYRRGDGAARGALDAWSALVKEAPADAEWLPLVKERIAQAATTLGIDPPGPGTPGPAVAAPPGGMPSSEAVAAAAQATAGAAPEQRQAM